MWRVAPLRAPQAASGCLRLPQAASGPHAIRLPQATRVETLGYDWEEAVRRLAPVLESGLKSAASGHPCPSGSVLRVLPPTWEALWAGGLTVWQVRVIDRGGFGGFGVSYLHQKGDCVEWHRLCLYPAV